MSNWRIDNTLWRSGACPVVAAAKTPGDLWPPSLSLHDLPSFQLRVEAHLQDNLQRTSPIALCRHLFPPSPLCLLTIPTRPPPSSFSPPVPLQPRTRRFDYAVPGFLGSDHCFQVALCSAALATLT
ncbi:hypothetical protein QC761_0090820 [Podospora bellae-mahoneyi]|uniref:Uncharacterized protein n=1 Tax=Podospora bellae-mahoneyi TaxID=2093777 RepID=A0ABR0FC91_9PEZI|nr:hypothetical protein QC761_0090820 [Podospora bellae-mahoneyi]